MNALMIVVALFAGLGLILSVYAAINAAACKIDSNRRIKAYAKKAAFEREAKMLENRVDHIVITNKYGVASDAEARRFLMGD